MITAAKTQLSPQPIRATASISVNAMYANDGFFTPQPSDIDHHANRHAEEESGKRYGDHGPRSVSVSHGSLHGIGIRSSI